MSSVYNQTVKFNSDRNLESSVESGQTLPGGELNPGLPRDRRGQPRSLALSPTPVSLSLSLRRDWYERTLGARLRWEYFREPLDISCVIMKYKVERFHFICLFVCFCPIWGHVSFLRDLSYIVSYTLLSLIFARI